MNEQALEMAVNRDQASIRRYLRYLGADPSVVDDLVQETFLAAFRSKTEVDVNDSQGCQAWLRGIARNMFLRHCRKLKYTLVDADSDYLEKAESFWCRSMLRNGNDGFEYVEALRGCLEKLTDKQKQIISLRYEQKTSRKEMSEQLKMTKDGIKTLLRRIRSLLGDCIDKQLSMEGVVP